MRRVLQLINGEVYGGAERVQDGLAQYLPHLGYSAMFICLKNGVFPAVRQSQDTPLIVRSMSSRLNIGLARELANVVREEKIELIHTHGPRPAILGSIASRLADVPMIHHIHSPTLRCTDNTLKNVTNTIVERLAIERASLVIAVSRSLKEYVSKQLLSESKVHVVYNGVEGLRRLPERSRPSFNWNLGVMGRFRPRKGLEVLVGAMSKLRASGKMIHLKVIGEFENERYKRSILRLAKELSVLDLITFVGFKKEINLELLTIDLLVLPSLRGEGLPMVMLEAMGAGVPVIATAVEGVPEVLVSGRDGLIAEPGSEDDLACQIGAFLDGAVDWHDIRCSAFEKQQSSYTVRVMAEKTAGLYSKLLAPCQHE